MSQLSTRHLLGIKELSEADIRLVLETAIGPVFLLAECLTVFNMVNKSKFLLTCAVENGLVLKVR